MGSLSNCGHGEGHVAMLLGQAHKAWEQPRPVRLERKKAGGVSGQGDWRELEDAGWGNGVYGGVSA